MSIRQVEKILVLADNNTIVQAGVFSDLDVGGVGQIDVEYMLAMRSTRCKKTSEGGGKLVID